MKHVKRFRINGTDVRQAACIELTGPPNAATKGQVGSLGIDITSAYHEIYKCVAVNGCIHTWELLASGESNGSNTSTGTGKSAYEYAKDGGYTGTEGQFAMLLANAVDKRNISIGLHTDGRMYLFINGESVGNGVALPNGATGDVVGNVDSGNNIVLNGSLASGTYTVKYEMEDGSLLTVGDFAIGGSSSGGDTGGNTGGDTGGGSTTDINLIPTSVDASKNPFNNGQGYLAGSRLSGSDGSVKEQSGCYVTGFMPYTPGNYIYIKDIVAASTAGHNTLAVYDSNFNFLKGEFLTTSTVITLNNGVYSAKPSNWTNGANAAWFRFSCGGITDESVATNGKEIA